MNFTNVNVNKMCKITYRCRDSMKVVQVKVPEFLSERDVKVAAAIEAFSRGSVSVGKAAEIAEISIQEFLLELRRRGIPAYPYTDKEASKELKL
ncbi:MAG: hypothetical protein AOA65_2241 [Candidatus Bathyarchaeota archaeon BA1]|nr:MAG: hypothetical protein AOA65_2241 [Candidatus Bathyarchaeota archaeon BA1]